MGYEELVSLLHLGVDRVGEALSDLDDWGPTGGREGEYRCDLAADQALAEVFGQTGLSIWSEESGRKPKAQRTGDTFGGELTVVVDPVDGSTNAARGVPYFATSLAVVDQSGPLVAVVANLATGTRYEAVKNQGARRNGTPITPSAAKSASEAIIGVNGWPERPLPWQQYRVMGASALEICAVADGSMDAYVTFASGLAPWDYLGAMLVCQEAGAVIFDRAKGALFPLEEGERRYVLAAATQDLSQDILSGLAGEK